MLHGGYGYSLVALSFALAMLAIYAILNGRRGLKAARASEVRFRSLAESVPQIVWSADPAGDLDYANQRWYDLTGFTEHQTLGLGWVDALHPDDRPVALDHWQKVRAAGERCEMDARLRSATGAFRWHLVRIAPLRNTTGAVIRWFGTCTDIDDQIRNQQVLEEQIRSQAAALMEANTRLEEEMRERALAQQELNQQTERMLQELTKRSNRATNLAKMAELLQSCTTLKDAFSVVAGIAPKVFPEMRGAVLLLHSSREPLQPVAVWSGCELPAGGLAPHDCWALRTHRAHVVSAGDRSAECGHAAARKYTYLCLPLSSYGESIGVLHLQMMEPGDPSQTLLSVANMFAEQISVSVSNIRLREALRNESIRDPLTGLYNRRYMEEMLERETRRAVRAEHGLGVLMLDLDHFKNFNDTYGHDAGDTVLRDTASFLLKSVRAEDIVCRFGGEEFIIILPVADFAVTHIRAERIRSKLREMHVLYQGQPLGVVTASIGVAALPVHGTSPRELIEAADAALYRAKREGRDRVVDAETTALEAAVAVPSAGPQPA